MSWYRSRITKRLRQAEQPLPDHDLTAHGGEWAPITDEEAAGDVRYVRNKAGSIHSVPFADLPAAVTAGGSELTVEEARTAAPRLFGEADPAILRVPGMSRLRENRANAAAPDATGVSS